LKQFSFNYHPGTRYISGVASSGSAAYLIGGRIAGGIYADVWKFESSKGWAHWAGAISIQNPVPGTIREPSVTNQLGSMDSSAVVVDSFDNLWIFGGYGRLTTTVMSMVI